MHSKAQLRIVWLWQDLSTVEERFRAVFQHSFKRFKLRKQYLRSLPKAAPHRALLQPSLLGAEAVGVGVPGWQDPSHTALGYVHLFQNHGGVLLQLLHLLADVRVFCGWGWKANRESIIPTSTESMHPQDTYPRQTCLNTSQKLASAFERLTPAEKVAAVCWPAPVIQLYVQVKAIRQAILRCHFCTFTCCGYLWS